MKGERLDFDPTKIRVHQTFSGRKVRLNGVEHGWSYPVSKEEGGRREGYNVLRQRTVEKGNNYVERKERRTGSPESLRGEGDKERERERERDADHLFCSFLSSSCKATKGTELVCIRYVVYMQSCMHAYPRYECTTNQHRKERRPLVQRLYLVHPRALCVAPNKASKSDLRSR